MRPLLPALAMMMMATGIVAQPALAQDHLGEGGEAFRQACAACHGATGHGNGELAAFLTVRPSDLTTLARDNGGAFPARDVYRIIDGRDLVDAHGARAMPVWGAQFSTDAAYGPYAGEAAVQARILEIVYYLQGLQHD